MYKLENNGYLHAEEGQNCSLSFTVEPPLTKQAKHTLFYGGKPVMTRRFMVQENVITFNNLRQSDSGIYTVRCSNREGMAGEGILELEVTASKSVMHEDMLHC